MNHPAGKPAHTRVAGRQPARRISRSDRDALLGQVINDEFEIVRAVGGGSHADVFLAKQRSMGDRWVAVKVLSRPYLNLREGDFRRAVRALLREGTLLGRFHAPVFIDVYRTGRLEDGRPYLAMEYVHGPTLAQMISELGRLDALTAIDLSVQICEGLAELHAAGFVHRDVTPSNVIVAESALGALTCRIFDFGTVTRTIDKPDRLRAGYDREHPLGTPAYMAPEQADAGVVDGRSDQFGVGAMLYEMLTGGRPVEVSAPGPRPLLEYLRGQEPIPGQAVDARYGMPSALAKAVHRALSRDPGRRYGSIGEFAEVLLGTRRRATAVTDIRAPRFLKRFFGVQGTDRGG